MPFVLLLVLEIRFDLVQVYVNRPALAPAFIVDQPPVNRVIAVPTQPAFYVLWMGITIMYRIVELRANRS